MTTVQRKRRHFRDDFKRQILSEIESGKMSIHNVKDDTGKQIKALLIERWKDQFRTEGLSKYKEEAAPKTESIPTKVAAKLNATMPASTDEMLRELGRLVLENAMLKQQAQNNTPSKSRAESGSSYSPYAKQAL